MPHLKIVKHNVSHFPFLVNSERSFVSTHGPNSFYKASILKTFWKYSGMQIFVAEILGKPVGYALFQYIGDNAWSLNTIFVSKPFRRKGVAKKVILFGLKSIPKKFVAEKFLATNLIGDVISDATLNSVGFVEVGTDLELYDGVGGKKFVFKT